MGFVVIRVWVMAYHDSMGHGMQIPANRVGGPIGLWDITSYGLSRVWVKTVSTVSHNEELDLPHQALVDEPVP